MLIHWSAKSFFTPFMSLYQNITHGFNVLDSIIWLVSCFVSTSVVVIIISSCTKPDSGITAAAVILLVINDADSCFRLEIKRAHSIEAFLVTAML